MKIKIGKINFINDHDDILNSYLNLKDYMNYFYLDNKEDVLFVNFSGYFNDAKEENNIKNGYYEFERNLMRNYKIVNYYELAKEQINEFIDRKAKEKYIENSYSRYDLYNKIEFSQIVKINQKESISFYYDNVDIDTKLNFVNIGEFKINLYDEKVENLDEIYDKGLLNKYIEKRIIQLEIMDNREPEFINEIMRINDFLKDKKTVNLELDGYEKFKVEANLYNFLNKSRNKNEIKFDLSVWAEKNFIKATGINSTNDLKLEDIKCLSYGKDKLDINIEKLKNIESQIAKKAEDKLKFKFDEIENILERKYYEIRYKYEDFNMPYTLKQAILELYRIEKQNIQLAQNEDKEVVEWDTEELENLIEINNIFENLKSGDFINNGISNLAHTLAEKLNDETIENLVNEYIEESFLEESEESEYEQ